jgi:hypothetical protein
MQEWHKEIVEEMKEKGLSHEEAFDILVSVVQRTQGTHTQGATGQDWAQEALEDMEEYFEEASQDQIDLDVAKAQVNGPLRDLQGAATMCANMLRRDDTSVRTEAADLLEEALGSLIIELEQHS